MRRSLPAELNDEIVSYLWNDNHALKACALTSRSLTHPSQKRLFHSVAICPRPEPVPETLSPYMDSDIRNATIGPFSNFHQLLDRSPHIAKYIISLHLSDLSWSFGMLVYEFEYPGIGLGLIMGRQAAQPRWLLTDMSLQTYLQLLRNLKALTIEYEGNLFDDSCSPFSAILQQHSLLYIRILRAPSPLQALNYTIGPNVKHLISLPRCEGEISLTYPSDPPSSIVYLESLTINYPSAFVSCMANSAFRLRTSRLRRIRIDSRDSHDNHVAAWTILQTCSSTVEEFELWPSNRTLIPHEAEDDEPEPIDLSKLTSLKRFTVDLCSSYLDRTIMNSYRWLIRILRTGNIPLEEMLIKVASECGEIDGMPWKGVCEVLLSGGFQNMKDLNIFIGSSSRSEVDMVVEALDTFEWIEKLRSCPNLNVTVKARTDYVDRYSPDIRWETWNRDLW